MSITRRQRGFFFLFVRELGRDVVYRVLSDVTKGKITSLRDQNLSQFHMYWVIAELIHRYPAVLSAREEKRGNNTKGDNLILLMTLDQRNAIATLRRITGISDTEYLGVCLKRIGNTAPRTSDEAISILDELYHFFIEKRKRKNDQ